MEGNCPSKNDWLSENVGMVAKLAKKVKILPLLRLDLI